MSAEKIAAAALRIGGNVIVSMPPPKRHHHLIHAVCRKFNLPRIPTGTEQGFLTSTGRYVDRKEAWDIAERADQIIARTSYGTPGLFSEDVW